MGVKMFQATRLLIQQLVQASYPPVAGALWRASNAESVAMSWRHLDHVSNGGPQVAFMFNAAFDLAKKLAKILLHLDEFSAYVNAKS